MATIKDIAKYAGVAQGTVSNVLNGKGNVSSKKIKQVMDAATALGYVPNERAKSLRKGDANVLAVILPNIRAKQYIDFYLAFKYYAEQSGYDVLLQLTNDDNHESEISAVQQARSYLVNGIATITSFKDELIDNPYYSDQRGNEKIIFVDRKTSFSNNFIGFDYEIVGQKMAERLLSNHHKNICLITGLFDFANEIAFYNGFINTLSGSDCTVHHRQIDNYRKATTIMKMFDLYEPDAIVVSNYDFTETVKDIYNTLIASNRIPIYTVSPIFTLPENDYIKYELNYSQLGAKAAEHLIKNIQDESVSPEMPIILEASGFRNWTKYIITNPTPEPLNILALDSPSAYTMKTLSHLYTKATGTPIHITIYSYDEMYEAYTSMNQTSLFDILRIDVTWLSWFAEKLLQPMDCINPSVKEDLDYFIPGIANHYSNINNHIYALPSTPSIQLMFYRKDLFESPIYKRMYWEQYKEELKVPATFDEYNRIASFFTQSINPSSPVKYGSTLTLGSTGVASSEYLARLFSHQENLYDHTGNIHLNSENSIHALEQLIEIKKYSNPMYCSWWTNTAEEFADGEAAMSIIYSNFTSDLVKQDSKVIGNIGFATVPGNNPQIGGGCLGVSKFTKRPLEALSYIRWICSEPISSARTILGGVSPCQLSYENFDIIKEYPWLKLSEKSFSNIRGLRTPYGLSQPFDERKMLSIIGMAVKNTYSGIQTAKDALDFAQKMYEKHFL